MRKIVQLKVMYRILMGGPGLKKVLTFQKRGPAENCHKKDNLASKEYDRFGP